MSSGTPTPVDLLVVGVLELGEGVVDEPGRGTGSVPIGSVCRPATTRPTTISSTTMKPSGEGPRRGAGGLHCGC